MRVVAVGGCGGMGRYAVRTVLTIDAVETVVIADVDAQRAAAFAGELGDDRAVPAGVDVADRRALRDLLAGADVVLNTVGPFYRFGVPVLRAAIAAGAHYLDICDDWEPTLEMLDLAGAAASAGVTAVVGLGASPGVSNLLAVRAMRELDEVQSVVTGWGVGGEGGFGGGAPSAAVVHWVHQCAGTIRLLRDGTLVDVAPLEPILVDYPRVGQGVTWTVGHPEAVTLHRVAPDLRDSMNVMVAAPWLVDAMREVVADVDAGRLSVEEAARRLVSGQAGAPDGDPAPPLPPLFAHAAGRRGGVPAHAGATVTAMPKRGMGGATGVPLGIGVRLLADGAISGHGVFAPEEAVDADAFFAELGRRCDPPRSLAELVHCAAEPLA